MKRRLSLVALSGLLAAALTPGGVARAQTPPAGAISKNVQYITTIPEMRTAIAINFIGDTMFVSTVAGLYSYDISDPTSPQLLGALPMYIWENEDMDVDAKRNLVFISRDPRGFGLPVPPFNQGPYGAVHIIDASNPAALRQVNAFLVPAGHTSTCINKCDFLWTAGPVRAVNQPAEWTGRPIFATDITDPLNPQPCPDPIDMNRDDGVTAYTHDVQVDAAGVAWVSGQGGVRGYWTDGRHHNPLTGKTERATGCKPIPYAGGGSHEGATPSRFMHNSWRNVKARASASAPAGTVLYGTEENVSTGCATAGRFAVYDLRGSYNGEGWRNIDKTKFRMRVLDIWTPEKQPGSDGCASAHYFSDRGDQVLAYGFYSQGTRFLDVSKPSDIRQIGYFRPDDANTWAAYWYRGYVFVADNVRGIDILKFRGGPGSPVVKAPALDAATPRPALEMDPAYGYLCPLP